MTTWEEVILYIKDQLRPGNRNATSVQVILNSLMAIINFINNGSADPENESLWDPAVVYPKDIQPVFWRDHWLVSNVADNQGIMPINESGQVHGAWRKVSVSSSPLSEWVAGVFTLPLHIVFNAGQLYYLDRAVAGTGPFNSQNFATELAAGQWKLIKDDLSNYYTKAETQSEIETKAELATLTNADTTGVLSTAGVPITKIGEAIRAIKTAWNDRLQWLKDVFVAGFITTTFKINAEIQDIKISNYDYKYLEIDGVNGWAENFQGLRVLNHPTYATGSMFAGGSGYFPYNGSTHFYWDCRSLTDGARVFLLTMDATGFELQDYRALKKGLQYKFTDYSNLVAGSLVPKSWVEAYAAPAGHNHDAAYLGITATAADASKLGGKAPAAYALVGTETLVSTTGIINDQATPSGTLRFTGAAAVSLSGLASGADGKDILIINATAFDITLMHQNAGSLAGNRLIIQGSDNVYVRPGGAARLRYSASQGAWQMSDLWGSEYFPTLKGTTTRTMQVTPGGYAQAEDNMELNTVLANQTADMTKADLNNAFPMHMAGQRVICPNLTNGAKVYEKYDDSTHDWISTAISKVV